jgi:hypothetical protein
MAYLPLVLVNPCDNALANLTQAVPTLFAALTLCAIGSVGVYAATANINHSGI